MKITKRQLRKIIQEMARPKLKYNVKVNRLLDALSDQRVEYVLQHPKLQAMNSFERGDDPVVSAFFDAEHALIKLVKILKAEDK